METSRDKLPMNPSLVLFASGVLQMALRSDKKQQKPAPDRSKASSFTTSTANSQEPTRADLELSIQVLLQQYHLHDPQLADARHSPPPY